MIQSILRNSLEGKKLGYGNDYFDVAHVRRAPDNLHHTLDDKIKGEDLLALIQQSPLFNLDE